MAVRDLHLLGSPALRQRSAGVGKVGDDTRRLVDDLFETMDAARGIGLAANQVGVADRVAVVGVEHDRLAMVNPVIVSAEGTDRAEEGCLSIPDVYAEVSRPARVVLEALDRSGLPYRLEAEGLLARAIQHEIDHLDGILFIDHLTALKRQLLLARYKREHRGDGILKTIRPEPARPE
ncbi:MAG: peptide deformylase [Gemmatimonadales bacterium]